MTMPFKAIISDLDGTLLNGEHRIGEFTIQTLSQLAEKGARPRRRAGPLPF